MGQRIVKYAINIFEYNMHLRESEKNKKEGECHQKKRRRSSIVYRCGVKNYKNITSNTENWRMIMKLFELQKTLGYYSTNI